MPSSRLALGTVQFGQHYGVANRGLRVDRAEAAGILADALASGMDTLDTAVGYGDSEQRLGEIGVKRWHVISKLPAVPDRCTDVVAWVQDVVAGSLQHLGIERLRGMLLHRPAELVGARGAELWGALEVLKAQKRVEKIGVSVYDPEELDALAPCARFDIVQAPFSIVDRRLSSSGWLTRLHQAGTEVHVRSVFLQGLLLMDPRDRPVAFDRWRSLWDTWERWLDAQSLTALQACVGFALSLPEINRVIVGVDSGQQLRQIVSCEATPGLKPPPELASDDPLLINPSRWILP